MAWMHIVNLTLLNVFLCSLEATVILIYKLYANSCFTQNPYHGNNIIWCFWPRNGEVSGRFKFLNDYSGFQVNN